MKIFSTDQVKILDKYTIDHEPISSIDLMERAATVFFHWIQQHLTRSEMYVFSGAGNNGGDALVIARLAKECGWNVKVFLLKSSKYSQDLKINIDKYKNSSNSYITTINNENDFPVIPKNVTIIDGLFGSGLNRPVAGLSGELIKHINASGGYVVAIDIPSGLMGEDNTENTQETVIKASVTLSFQYPKLSFLFPENEIFVGDWHVLDIGLHADIIDNTPSKWQLLTHDLVKKLLPSRKKFSHKGTYGHGLLISGSYGKMGAAVLASKSCLKSGIGLLTVHVPRLGYEIIQTAVPEAMVSIDRSDILFSEFPDINDYDAVGIGPGIGLKINSGKGLYQLLENINDKPLVIDADGLNLLSQHEDWLTMLPENTILTPHPKEFERLAGSWKSDYQRLKLLTEFSSRYNVITVLKGAHTTISLPDGTCYFNTTGNAGMATAGSGDVLTGIILALLSQGIIPHKAALLAVYLHGLSGDIYVSKESEEGLCASDIISNLGIAFREIKKVRYYHR